MYDVPVIDVYFSKASMVSQSYFFIEKDLDCIQVRDH